MVPEKMTTAELRKQNRNKVFQMIYNEKRTSKQEIASKLDMSLPTVSQNLKELEDMQLIERNGLYESSGGRKPQAICCIKRSRVAIGIAASKNHVHIACIDLYGCVIKEGWFDLPYDTCAAYYKQVGDLLRDFINSLRITNKKILGVGISLQGIVSADSQFISYGSILNNTGVKLQDFADFIPYPCHLIHDAEAAAITELHFNPNMDDTVYLAISDHIGSAIILNGSIYHGGHAGGGFIEHMTLVPDGLSCYCGKKGCFEAYASLRGLCGSHKNVPDFFAAIQSKDHVSVKRWEDYLQILASAIDYIHMVIDCDVLIGGPLTPHMTEEDLNRLNSLVLDKCVFPDKKPYVFLSRCHDSVDVVGSALTYIDRYINEI